MELVLRVWQNLDKMRIIVGGAFNSLKCCRERRECHTITSICLSKKNKKIELFNIIKTLENTDLAFCNFRN